MSIYHVRIFHLLCSVYKTISIFKHEIVKNIIVKNSTFKHEIVKKHNHRKSLKMEMEIEFKSFSMQMSEVGFKLYFILLLMLLPIRFLNFCLQNLITIMEAQQNIFKASFLKGDGSRPSFPPDVTMLHASALSAWSLLLTITPPSWTSTVINKWGQGIYIIFQLHKCTCCMSFSLY